MPGVVLSQATDAKAGITKYRLTWVSDASGNVSGMPVTIKSGTLIAVEFIPGVGLTQPDNLYDVDLVDANGISVFDDGAGTTIGSNLSNVAGSHRQPLTGLSLTSVYRRWFQGGAVELRVAAAGDTNSGTVDVYVSAGVL